MDYLKAGFLKDWFGEEWICLKMALSSKGFTKFWIRLKIDMLKRNLSKEGFVILYNGCSWDLWQFFLRQFKTNYVRQMECLVFEEKYFYSRESRDRYDYY